MIIFTLLATLLLAFHYCRHDIFFSSLFSLIRCRFAMAPLMLPCHVSLMMSLLIISFIFTLFIAFATFISATLLIRFAIYHATLMPSFRFFR